MQSAVLIERLVTETHQAIEQALLLQTLNDNILKWRSDANSWCILECIAHLNLYGNFYLPEFKNKIFKSETVPSPIFQSGLLGSYFAKSMLPKPKLNKMKTFKNKNPLHFALDRTVIEVFIHQQQELLTILDRSKNTNLNSVTIAISISKLFKLKLGDALQFYNNHIIRHLQQIGRIQQEQLAH